jgi:quinol monooxygenase YgiN
MAIPSLIVGAGAVQATDAKLRIHRHDAARPFPVNAYIVEGNDGLVVVDATLTESSAAALRKRIEVLAKPLRAVLLTHSHPDHYAGIGVLAAGWDLPIVALAALDDVVRRDDAAKDALSAPLFGAEWPRNRVFASQRVPDGDRLDYGGGLAFTVMDIGPAESLHDSIWILDSERPIAFSGEVTAVAIARAKPGHEEELGRRMMALITPTLAEPGCINYDLHRSNTDPAVWIFYENWRSQADLDAHMQTEHYKSFFSRADEVLAHVDAYFSSMMLPPGRSYRRC